MMEDTTGLNFSNFWGKYSELVDHLDRPRKKGYTSALASAEEGARARSTTTL